MSARVKDLFVKSGGEITRNIANEESVVQPTVHCHHMLVQKEWKQQINDWQSAGFT